VTGTHIDRETNFNAAIEDVHLQRGDE